MSKSFEMPKEFGEKWIKALRSGEYKQTDGTLVNYDFDEITNEITEVHGYCCLGVACRVANVEVVKMAGYDLINDIQLSSDSPVPNILQETNFAHNLVDILTQLNDGLTYNNYKIMKSEVNVELDIIPTEDNQRVNYNFNQIADFIEKNVEFV